MKKLFLTLILFHLITASIFAHHNGIHHHHSDVTMYHCMTHGHYHTHKNNLNKLKVKHSHSHVTMADFFLEQTHKVLFHLEGNPSIFSLNIWLPNPLLKDFFHPPRI